MDNLFDAGLTSLDLAGVLARVRERYPSLRVSPLTLFQHPTVERMAAYMDGAGRADVRDPARADRGEIRRRMAIGATPRLASGPPGATRRQARTDTSAGS
jgi:aryl carrier-like protein